ncbi:pyridoxamine 5'-phosphate oxidase family protein [Halorussus amylolyticus]|uniref:pyridoxamine 5'-phosphate oxidase family protein n=1 Tax=Halorussus amylolyticus TaxID=1126242 RepID=UPI00104FBB31|nr:pyridoxamine 5'-phosphate oxidase family protein [Halorussus amylolyticus]
MSFHTPAETTPNAETTPEVEMDEAAVDDFLERRGWGCLTLAKDDSAYSIPMSFGYDGDSTLYFQLQATENSEKMAYLDATTTAAFLVPEVAPPDWTSVVARGELRRVPDDEIENVLNALADNAWFPLAPWVEGGGATDLKLYKLDADELTGRSSMA